MAQIKQKSTYERSGNIRSFKYGGIAGMLGAILFAASGAVASGPGAGLAAAAAAEERRLLGLLHEHVKSAARPPRMSRRTPADQRVRPDVLRRSEPVVLQPSPGEGTVPASRRSEQPSACQRWPLYVDFNKIYEKSWIIEPTGYEAYLCHGECSFPLTRELNATNHAIFHAVVHEVNQTVPTVCCVPTKFSAISLVYYDDNQNPAVKDFEDMVVEQCGCR